LAVQFIDHTVKDFQKISLKQISNPVKIGEGAAAVVYKAQFRYTDVAVKKLKAQSLIVNNKLSLEFQREVEALTRICHPNLVLFMGTSVDDGHPVIVTEFCNGGTLFELLHEKRKSVPHISYK
jgi:serine/threonine protein kinase